MQNARKQGVDRPARATLAPATKAADWTRRFGGVALMSDDISCRVFHAHLLFHKTHDIARSAIDQKADVSMAGAMRELFAPEKDNS
ncbi:hypothetical protein [Bradyrhizobium sp. CB3481]|uniref:hypothetical protein n=1 Tax=Bradyrhizobium sp. CB3481 TaxID=3039158 RepID=UPI0024B12A25|nr:hypothetical protein [Bradyrhizobium sp. CB3481]WFU14585.1 hypothetical protein QA643_26130 [Bradyrhizobium sp. CB3481]